MTTTPEIAPMPPRLPLALLFAALAAGCASFPELDAAVSDDAWKPGYPALLPTEELRAAARPATDRAEAPGPEAEAEVEARAARLRARAARLRGDNVIDPASKARLNRKIETDESGD